MAGAILELSILSGRVAHFKEKPEKKQHFFWSVTTHSKVTSTHYQVQGPATVSVAGSPRGSGRAKGTKSEE